MGKKLYFPAILILLLSFSFAAIAQETVYVDMTQANQTIEAYKTENSNLQAENDSLTATNQDNQNKIDSWNKSINEELDPLRANVVKKISDIRTLLVNIIDENMKANATDALTKAKTLLAKLDKKRKMLTDSISKAEADTTENNNKIQRNKLKIQSNNKLIADLEAGVKSTQAQNATLTEYIGSVTDFISNAESLVDGVEVPEE